MTKDRSGDGREQARGELGSFYVQRIEEKKEPARVYRVVESDAGEPPAFNFWDELVRHPSYVHFPFFNSAHAGAWLKMSIERDRIERMGAK